MGFVQDFVLEKVFSLSEARGEGNRVHKYKQGNHSLIEYERKFDKLSRYVPHLVDTEEHKARRFEKGLRLELYKTIAMFQFSTYSKILQ